MAARFSLFIPGMLIGRRDFFIFTDVLVREYHESSMDIEPEPPPIPDPVPEIPVGPLWVTLLVPPAVIVLCALLDLVFKNSGAVMFSAAPTLAAAFILGMSFVFHSLVGLRYRGKSLVFLDCCYVFGQIIVCLVLWVGSCLVFL